MKADKVFYNGIIYTMVREGETAEAVAVYDGKIVAVGSNEEIRNMEAREYIDLGGKPVIPGMADTHMHLYQDCMEQDKVSMAEVRSFAEIIDTAGEALQGLSSGEWLLAENLHMDNLKEGYFPTAPVLDQISKEIPVCIGSYCHHVHILNSRALEICGIDRNTDDHGKNTIELDESGNPNGIIRDRSVSLQPTRSIHRNIRMKEKGSQIIHRHQPFISFVMTFFTNIEIFDHPAIIMVKEL